MHFWPLFPTFKNQKKTDKQIKLMSSNYKKVTFEYRLYTVFKCFDRREALRVIEVRQVVLVASRDR
jgi:hypothetical protein